MLDVRRLQVLRSVLATGSVSRAAEALGYTPSSVSQQMAALQRETGLTLLEHVGRGVRPTAAARLLDERAGAIFDQIDAVEQALEDYRDGRGARLRMEYFTTAGQSLVAPAVAAFHRRNPGARVELLLEPAGDPALRVSRGEVDVALISSEVPAGLDGVTETHLFDDPFDVVLPADHRLASQEAVAVADLAGEPWVTHEWPLGSCSEPLLRACAAHGFRPDICIECNDIDTAQGLIATGLGLGVMPRLGLAAPHDGVVVRPLVDPAPQRRIRLLRVAEPHAEEMARAITGVDAGGAGAVPQARRG